MTIAATWRKLFGSFASYRDIPTVDYYFLGALGDLVRGSKETVSDRPILRCGPTTFVVGRRLVIVRYLSPKELTWIRRQAFEQVYYVIDDMLPIAEHCSELPASYRSRLARFTRDMLPNILALSPTIVAPNQAILELFPNRPTELIHPCCLQVADDFSHFGSATSRPHQVRLAFLGTRSHAAGMSFLTPVLQRLGRRSDIRCTLFFGKHIPAQLKSLPSIDNRNPLSWEEYRQFSASERYHMVLAPLPDTPFNRGRSLTKVMETAGVGGVGLFSAREPFSGGLKHGHDGLLLEDDPALWMTEIERLAANLPSAKPLAEGLAVTAQRLGDRQNLRLFWLERLGVKAEYHLRKA